MINGERLDRPTTEGAGIEFAFTVPSLFLLTLMPLGAIIIGFAAYLIIFGTTDRTSWTLNAPPSGTELQIAVYMGACDDFEGIAVKETDIAVTVAAYIRAHDACGDDAVPLILLREPKTVQLSAPLGGRALHGCNPPNAVHKGGTYSDEDCADTYPH